ncbi:hypothetical protein MRX96_034113 [Rhipicephalus microplus]
MSLLTVLLENVANGRSSWYVGWRLVMDARLPHVARVPVAAADQRLMRPQWQGFLTKVLLSPDAVFEVLGVVKRVRNTLEERLRQATWMDPETRVRAFTKLEALREQLPKFFVFDGRTPEYEAIRSTAGPDALVPRQLARLQVSQGVQYGVV